MAVIKKTTKKRTGGVQVFGNTLLRLIDSRMVNNNCDGIITEVDEAKFTTTVKVSEVEFHEVPLRVLISSQASFIEIPKIGTNCVVVFRDANMGRPYILEVHECTKILCKVGTSTFNVTESGFLLTRGNSGLKKTLTDLIDAINTMTVTTPSGPSGTPINATVFTNIKTDLNNYLT
jgi:hypothetical protein